jgi:hypothetical protein
MRFVLEVQSGSGAGRALVLQPGQVAHVGRSDWADLTVGDDPALSNLHFLIEAGPGACHVRDLNSASGILLNGRKVMHAAVGAGDWIRAGRTEFALRRDSDVGDLPLPAAADPPQAAVPAPGSSDRLLQVLRAQDRPLFAILDAARDPLVLGLLVRCQEEYHSLYAGVEGDRLAAVAPYLVHLPPSSPLLETLARHAWGKSWGMYLTCGQPFEAVRKHFRRFLLVTAEDGRELYFRFYDPRVTRAYLPTCTPQEAREFFGPVDAYLMEGTDPATLLVFSRDDQAARATAVPLDSATADASMARTVAGDQR